MKEPRKSLRLRKETLKNLNAAKLGDLKTPEMQAAQGGTSPPVLWSIISLETVSSAESLAHLWEIAKEHLTPHLGSGGNGPVQPPGPISEIPSCVYICSSRWC